MCVLYGCGWLEELELGLGAVVEAGRWHFLRQVNDEWWRIFDGSTIVRTGVLLDNTGSLQVFNRFVSFNFMTLVAFRIRPLLVAR